MKKFLKENWFKVGLLVLLAWFILVLQDGLGISVRHRGAIDVELDGYVESNYDSLDGTTIYSR